MKTKKAQISIEFLFALGIVIFIFIILLAFIFDRNEDVRRIQAELDMRSDCYLLSNSIYNAYINSLEGEQISLSIKTSHDINVFSEGRVLEVIADNQRFLTCTIPINTTRNANNDATFTLTKGLISINGTNKFITLKNV